MKQMNRCKRMCLVSVFLLMLVLPLLTACSRYDEEWIIGKTSSEIEERYGSFDYIMENEQFPDGSESCRRCAYLIKKERVGFFGTDPTEYFLIVFDADGKAQSIESPWYVPGG